MPEALVKKSYPVNTNDFFSFDSGIILYKSFCINLLNIVEHYYIHYQE